MKPFKRHLKPFSERAGMQVVYNKKTFIDFSSNDYLGLASDPKLIKKTALQLQKSSQLGSTSSRLLSGDSTLHHSFEQDLSDFLSYESCLCFSSGFQLNCSIFKSLFSKKDIIFCDKQSHASLLDGIELSKATLKRFAHNDLSHLESLLKTHRKTHQKALIVTEGLFSMDGDITPLKDLIELKKRYDCELFLDEAHSFGIFGKGRGLAYELGCQHDIDFSVIAFGKAMGAQGACIATSLSYKEQIIQHCRGFIYSTGIAPLLIIALKNSLEALRENPTLGKKLQHKAQHLRDALRAKLKLPILGDAQIISVICPSETDCLALSQRLKSAGLLAHPIFYPTVPKVLPRIRICLSLLHTTDNIEALIEALCH